MRILIIEDERKASEFLRKGLTESGFIADVAENGEDGLFNAMSLDYDLVVLDAMLARKDGWSVLAEMRQKHKSTPVLFLTARGAVSDRSEASSSALTATREALRVHRVLARVRALLRRRAERQPEILQIADLRVDLLGHKAHRGR